MTTENQPTVEEHADALYKAGYLDRQLGHDYDPRGCTEWQSFVDAVTTLTQPATASPDLNEQGRPITYWGGKVTTPTEQPSQAGPIGVEVVGEVWEGPDGTDVLWSVEGGVCSIPAGTVLLISHRPITDDDGHGEVYITPPKPVPMSDDQVWHSEAIMSANGIAAFKMDALMRIVRAVEAHHHITSKEQS